jgi:predicted nucleotidyltransferase
LKNSLDYNIIKNFAIENGIDFIAVYGSYYSGDETVNSDLDLIIDSKSALNNDNLKIWSKKLKSLLNINVDLITPQLLISSLLCGYVWRLKEYKVIYGSPVVS